MGWELDGRPSVGVMKTHTLCLANSVLATAVFILAPGLWPSLAVIYLTAVVLVLHKSASRR